MTELNIIKTITKVNIIILIILYASMLKAITIDKNFIVSNKGDFRVEIKDYKKIIALDPAAIEIIYDLGEINRVIGIGSTSTIVNPQEVISKIPTVGTMFQPSIEKIISMNPDLVIINYATQKVGIDLQKRGIAVIYFEANSFNDIFENTLYLAKVFNKEKEATSIINEKKKLLQDIKSNPLSNLNGAFLYSLNPIIVSGKGTMAYEMLELFGVNNVASNVDARQGIFSIETILNSDVDFLIATAGISDSESLLNSYPALRNTPAGKNKNIFALKSGVILRGSPETFNEIEKLYMKLKQISVAKNK